MDILSRPPSETNYSMSLALDSSVSSDAVSVCSTGFSTSSLGFTISRKTKFPSPFKDSDFLLITSEGEYPTFGLKY